MEYEEKLKLNEVIISQNQNRWTSMGEEYKAKLQV